MRGMVRYTSCFLVSITVIVTPLVGSEASTEPSNLPSQGLWLGLGGLAAGLIFDATGQKRPRTFSYGLMGLGLGVAAGSYGTQNPGEEASKTEPKLRTKRARTFGSGIGEASNLHLIGEGVYFHPMYNDVNGSTDKLLTASAKIGYLNTWENLSFETVLFWRFLTPSFRAEFNGIELDQPAGRYADWGEIKSSLAYTWAKFDLLFRSQIAGGVSDVGNKGGREVHRAIHNLTRNSLDELDYTNQPRGRFGNVGIEQGVILHRTFSNSHSLELLPSIGAETGRFMTESSLNFNSVYNITQNLWEQAFEFRLVKQHSSDVYEDIRPFRYEVALGFRFKYGFTPAVKYVSPYLTQDPVGQTYFDVIHYNYQF